MTPNRDKSIVVEALEDVLNGSAALVPSVGYRYRKAIRLAELHEQAVELLRGIGERHRFDPKEFDSIYALLAAIDKESRT